MSSRRRPATDLSPLPSRPTEAGSATVANDDLEGDEGLGRSDRRLRRRPRRRGCRAGRKVKIFRGQPWSADSHLSVSGTGVKLRRVGCLQRQNCDNGGVGSSLRQCHTYDRTRLLAIRDQTGRGGPSDDVTGNIRCSLPPRLSHLIRRRPNRTNIRMEKSFKIRMELLNIQSLLLKLPDVMMDVQQNEPDLLFFTETNLKSATPNRYINIPGYSKTTCRSDRKLGRKKSGGGVIILAKDKYNPEVIMKTSENNSSHMDTVWIKVKFDQRRTMIAACIYRSPNTSGRQNEDDFSELERQLHAVICHTPTNIVISGDFNADAVTNPAGARRLRQLAEGCHMRMLVNEPTYIRGSCRSTLDNILIYMREEANMNEAACKIENCHYSAEHLKVLASLSVRRFRHLPPQRKLIRDYRQLTSEEFLSELSAISWRREVHTSIGQQ